MYLFQYHFFSTGDIFMAPGTQIVDFNAPILILGHALAPFEYAARSSEKMGSDALSAAAKRFDIVDDEDDEEDEDDFGDDDDDDEDEEDEDEDDEYEDDDEDEEDEDDVYKDEDEDEDDEEKINLI
jgi:hypothetical protein